MLADKVDHRFKEFEQRLWLPNAAADHHARVLLRAQLFNDLINGAVLIQADGTDLHWNARGIEPSLLAGQRCQHGIRVDAEMRDGARVDADDEDMRSHTVHDNSLQPGTRRAGAPLNGSNGSEFCGRLLAAA